LPAKQILRTIFSVAAGKYKCINGWIHLKLPEYISLPDFQHAKIRGIYLASPAGFDNIADTCFFPDKKILPFFYSLTGIIIAESEIKDFVQNRPEHSIATPVAKVDIPLPEASLRKPWRRQSPDDYFFCTLGNENFVGV
jgi:hypothetical protein